MSPIAQNVIPRNRTSYSSLNNFKKINFQRGSVNSTTVTLGFSIVTISLLAALSFFYLGQVLTTASQGSNIQALEEKMDSLKEKQRFLELEGAQLRSIQTIEEQIPQLNLVPADQVAYMVPTTGKVAALDK